MQIVPLTNLFGLCATNLTENSTPSIMFLAKEEPLTLKKAIGYYFIELNAASG